MKDLFLLISLSFSSLMFSQNNKEILMVKYGSGVTDIEGNSYKTVVIGNQEWLGENLKVTKFNDGTIISNITDKIQWSKDSLKPMICFYTNEKGDIDKNNVLYNWNSVSKTTNGNKSICPKKWHVPSFEEWSILIDHLGGDTIAGPKMKVNNLSYWSDPNSLQLNSSLFSSFSLGFRFDDGEFINDGKYAHFWINSEYERKKGFAYVFGLMDNMNEVQRFGLNKNVGVSVRCLKD